MEKENIKVSIICVTYNQEKYIEDALNGFIMQKTNFDYEVIVHDDASSDNTRMIIEEYAAKYDFIKPIYEEENQYSKDVNLLNIIVPYVKGKYVCYCEGDDYWTDPLKLQKQYDYMETHPGCSVVGHSYIRKNMENNTDEIISTENKNGVISVETIIENTYPLHVSTQMHRVGREEEIPDFFFSIKKVGDYPALLYYATQGEIHFLEDIMSVYRFRVNNSWTTNISDHPANVIPCFNDIYSFLKKFDEYTGKKYHTIVAKRLKEITGAIEYNLSFLKEKYELEKKESELINEYKEQIDNDEVTINNFIKLIDEYKEFTEDLKESIDSISRIIECRPYKFANKVHNIFNKMNKNRNIIQENIDFINQSLDSLIDKQ